MKETHKIVLFGVILYLVQECLSGATLEQYMDAGRMMRNICEPKFKISKDIMVQFESKQTPNDKNLKCFVNCIFEMTKAIKRGKYQLDAALKQVDMMVPDHMKKEYKDGIMSCKDSGKGSKDPCEISYEIFKCLIKEVPSFVIP